MMPLAKGPAGSAAATELLADGFRTNSAAWRWIDCQDGEPISRAEHVARPARLASCPASRPADAEREGCRDAASRWLAKHDKPTAARKTQTGQGGNVAKM